MPRLDVLIADRGLAESRARAQALIMAGRVTVAGSVVTKAGTAVSSDATVLVAQPPRSRLGCKCEASAPDFLNLTRQSHRKGINPQTRQAQTNLAVAWLIVDKVGDNAFDATEIGGR